MGPSAPMLPAAERARVLIADSNDRLADLIGQLLSDEPDLSVVGVATDAGIAVRLARRVDPSVVLVDSKLGDVSGVAVCSALRAICPAAALLLWSYEPDASSVRLPHVDGLLERGMSYRELVTAIRAATRAADRSASA